MDIFFTRESNASCGVNTLINKSLTFVKKCDGASLKKSTWKLIEPCPSFELPSLEAIWYTSGKNLYDWTCKPIIQFPHQFMMDKANYPRIIKAQRVRMRTHTQTECTRNRHLVLYTHLLHCAIHCLYNTLSCIEAEPQGNKSKYLNHNFICQWSIQAISAS